MVLKIERDLSRFRQIVRGRIRKDLKKYISNTELIAKQGNRYISIPLPQVEIPHFRYGHQEMGGVGQGEGKAGTPIGIGEQEGGSGEAGNLPGEHLQEVEITIEELAEILGEELELPKIEPRGKKNLKAVKERYSGISHTGPESLRHFKRTYKASLRRQIISGTYNRKNPIVIPLREDRWYRSSKDIKLPENNAVIIYMMDVSGSMGDEQKEIVRIEAFWIDTWLRSQYKDIESRYIIHDAEAREVDQDTFYHTRQSGGTVISSAYKLCSRIIDGAYPVDDWNIYLFHFSDGENWEGGDTEVCIKILNEDLLHKANLFGYAQVASENEVGRFLDDLKAHFGDDDTLVLSKITDKEEIYESIRDFFKKGN
jgi:uncharacterized sporulation protein YeaH/YhbH (DUF444 family)